MRTCNNLRLSTSAAGGAQSVRELPLLNQLGKFISYLHICTYANKGLIFKRPMTPTRQPNPAKNLRLAFSPDGRSPDKNLRLAISPDSNYLTT